MESSLAPRPIWEGRKSALIFAHPGHEVLLHRFLEEAKPVVFVLTSGNTHGEEVPVRTSARIVRKAGASLGGIFGRCTSSGLQHALLMGERNRFNALASELADELIEAEIDLVAGDSAEGIDPAHDLCRVLIDAAVSIAALTRPGIKNYEVPLLGERTSRASVRILVDGEAWRRKLNACRAYADPVHEVRHRMEAEGIDSLREECLRLATPWSIRQRLSVVYSASDVGTMPLIQFREHFLPIAGAVQGFVTGRREWAA